MLSDSEISSYHREGYVTPDFKLAESSIGEIKQRHQNLLNKYPEFDNYCPALLAYDKSFLEFAKQPGILDMVEQLIGPDFALWNSSFLPNQPTVATLLRGIKTVNTGQLHHWQPARYG